MAVYLPGPARQDRWRGGPTQIVRCLCFPVCFVGSLAQPSILGVCTLAVTLLSVGGVQRLCSVKRQRLTVSWCVPGLYVAAALSLCLSLSPSVLFKGIYYYSVA